jgi:hypothetical protein
MSNSNNSHNKGLDQTFYKIIVFGEYKYLLKRGGIVVNKV